MLGKKKIYFTIFQFIKLYYMFYNVHSKCTFSFLFFSGSKVTSSTKDKDGSPLMEMEGNTIKVRTMNQLASVLRIGGNSKMIEARACLEGVIDFNVL